MQQNLPPTGTAALLETDKNNIWHPFTPFQGDLEPLLITGGQGIYLHTDDGRKIIDAISSWWVNLHGHGNPHIAEAIAKQAKKLEHVIFAGFTHEPAIKLSQNLLRILPANQSRIFFSDNGSTAVEVGIKMALQYWHNRGTPKRKVIAFNGAYHGDTFGAMAVGGRSAFTKPFDPFLFSVAFVDLPTPHNVDDTLNRFDQLIRDQDVAAFIFEPLVQAAGGMNMYAPEHLDRFIQKAQANQVICIADEVFTGFGRTGELFASDYLKNKPDIMAISKGITGGALPLGVTSCSQEIVSAYQQQDFTKTFFHGHSYTANPIACEAANASFELLMQDDCRLALRRIQEQHITFASRIKHHPRVKEARCLGTILAIELTTKEESSYFNTIRNQLYAYFLTRNILLRPLGNVIYILPPYIITNNELKHIYKTIEEFLNT